MAQRLLYQTLLWLALPLIPLRLLVRGFKERGYRQHVAERFGAGAAIKPGADWIHAVSVGEVRAAAPLIAALLGRGHRVVLTCMTPAGRVTAEQLFGARITLRYLPYDYGFALRRFFSCTQPARGIIMETELWPNLVRTAARLNLPLYLVNARLSERSARGYRKFAALTSDVLTRFKAVAAQTEQDAARLRELGAPNVRVTGNLKFDIEPPQEQLVLANQFRSWTGGRALWLAASTRDGEEKLILRAFQDAAPESALLVLVPRHPQRFEAVATLARDIGLVVQTRSETAPVRADTRVWLGDTLGEMFAYYAAADSALIGGSLLPYGGQNLIEACAVGCPVLIGTHTENFAQAAEDAIAAGAARRVQSAEQWVAEASCLSASIEARSAMAQAGRTFADAHKGASAKVLQLIGD